MLFELFLSSWVKISLAENLIADEDDPYRLRELNAFSDGFVEWAEGPEGDLD